VIAVLGEQEQGKGVVDRCILDEEVNIGKFCYVGFGADSIRGCPNITVLGRDTIVPPGTAVGRNRRIDPGTKLLAGVNGQRKERYQ